MTENVERFDTDRQRAALVALHENHVEFLSTAEGAAFLEQLNSFMAPGGIAIARDWGYQVEKDEVVNLVLVRLLENNGRRLSHVITAAKPWNYLGTGLREWLREEFGTRGTSLDALDAFEALEYTGFGTPDDFQEAVGYAVKLTYFLLESRTPEHLLAELKELIGFLAVNPPARLSYEHYEMDWAMRYAPSFTEPQIREVMNLTWGGRPNRWETSVLGQFARDPEFDPMSSGTHARAVHRYRRMMATHHHSFDA